VIAHRTELVFGLNPLAFKLSSLFFHLLNVGLVYALGWWPMIGWRNSAIAAGSPVTRD
jgi:hypothetical protein